MGNGEEGQLQPVGRRGRRTPQLWPIGRKGEGESSAVANREEVGGRILSCSQWGGGVGDEMVNALMGERVSPA